MKQRGFSIIEVLLSVAIFSLFVMATAGAILYGEEGNALSGKRNRAAALAGEGVEALRNIRDSNFSNFLIGSHGLTTVGNIWGASGTSDETDIFSRTLAIATASGSDDKRDVTSSAAWQQNLQRPGIVSIYTRFTNWFRKFGNWASPSQQANINLPGNQAGNKVAVAGGYAYIVRNGGTPNFAVIDISNSGSIMQVGSLNLAGLPLNIYISGNYAYISSSDNAQELQVVDITSPTSPVLVSSLNLPGNANANGVWSVGTTVYITRAGNVDNFVILNISTPTSPTQTSTLSLAGPLYETIVLGKYAYISSGNNASELQVVDVSNPSSPTLVGTLNLASNADAVTIAGYQNPETVFLGQNNGTVSIVDVSNPLLPFFISSFAAGVSVNDVALGLGSGYLFLATAHSTQEFQALDVSTLLTPTLLATANLGNALNGVIYDQVRDRAYVVSTSNSAEFIIVKPL